MIGKQNKSSSSFTRFCTLNATTIDGDSRGEFDSECGANFSNFALFPNEMLLLTWAHF